jgi:hypothetical protein
VSSRVGGTTKKIDNQEERRTKKMNRKKKKDMKSHETGKVWYCIAASAGIKENDEDNVRGDVRGK